MDFFFKYIFYFIPKVLLNIAHQQTLAYHQSLKGVGITACLLLTLNLPVHTPLPPGKWCVESTQPVPAWAGPWIVSGGICSWRVPSYSALMEIALVDFCSGNDVIGPATMIVNTEKQDKMEE